MTTRAIITIPVEGHGQRVPVSLPSSMPRGDQVNVLAAVAALLKLSPEQRRLAMRAVREGAA